MWPHAASAERPYRCRAGPREREREGPAPERAASEGAEAMAVNLEARSTIAAGPDALRSHRAPKLLVAGFAGVAVVGLLLLDVVGGWRYSAAVLALTLAILGSIYGASRDARSLLLRWRVSGGDLLAIAVTYILVIALYRTAFVVVEDNDLLLFVFFAAGLVSGIALPVVYTVWVRRRSLATLGLSGSNVRS